MQNTVNVRLQQAYKAEADWKSSDPVGKKGEIMISSDKNGMFKVGNGTSKWSELNYNNANYASSAGSVAWGNVSGKPSSMPASDVYAWAKASSKPSYSWSEITGKPSTFTPASHTHTASQITDFPESLKNPNSVIITLNGGSTEGTNLFIYDGSSSKNINITPTSIGAAAISHTHTDLIDAANEKTTVLKIVSTNGIPPLENVGSTVLSVVIYNGRNRITNLTDLHKLMSSDAHLKWSYCTEGGSYTDLSETDSRISNDGFTFTPSESDNASRLSFKCQLITNGSGYITPDHESAIKKIEERLQTYVNTTLFPSIDTEFDEIKNNVIQEISSDTYIAKIEENANSIDELKSKLNNTSKDQGLHLAWLGWSNNIELGNGIENDAVMFSKHDIVGMQRLNLNRLADSKPSFTENTIKILKRAKELNPNLRTFEYLQSESGRTDFTYNDDHAHLNSDGSWEGSTADLSGCTRIYTYQQICDWLDYFKESGTDGVFFDDWGYDFAKRRHLLSDEPISR